MKAIAYMPSITLRTPADIGAHIRDRRKALAMDQAALAARIGVSRLWVNQVERGKPGASMGLVLRALAAVGVEIKASASGGDQMPGVGHDSVGHDINAIVDRARRVERP